MDHLEVYKYPLLIAGGVLAGIINTLAGNGSAITLSLLMLFGLPSSLANATNRVGVLLQAGTSLISLRRTPEVTEIFQNSKWAAIPALLGSAAGAILAVDINEQLLRLLIGCLMLVLFVVLLVKGGAIYSESNTSSARPTITNWLLFLAMGLYAGFIQMGIGIIMLAIMTLIMPYGLRKANILKQLLVFLFVLLPFIIFVASGMIEWQLGLTLAIGQTFGAWVAARFLLQNPRAQSLIRRLLLFILLVSGLGLLGVFELIEEVL